jgi:ribosomal protein S18 acetylase RimI-like enzyme
LPRTSMHSDTCRTITIRPMIPADRPAVADIVEAVGNFNPVEIDVALELIDIYLNDENQRDYLIVVATDREGVVRGYACWGPVPLTKGTYDLYWIATHPSVQGQGYGRAVMEYVEDRVRLENGRLLVLETSAKESYGATVRFYRNLGYEEASRIRDFYDVGDDKLVFVRRISR